MKDDCTILYCTRIRISPLKALIWTGGNVPMTRYQSILMMVQGQIWVRIVFSLQLRIERCASLDECIEKHFSGAIVSRFKEFRSLLK